MRLEISGPAPCRLLTWRPANAGTSLTLVCKVTYDLLPGTCRLRAEQEPLRDRDEPHDGDPRSSIWAPADLAPLKPWSEVLLVGSAFAPHGRPTAVISARLRVATIDKTLEAHPPRRRYPDGRIVAAGPITWAPLRWEQAAAGWENPVGVRTDIPIDPLGGIPVPTVSAPSAQPGPPFSPAGFGPISPYWPSRASLLVSAGIHSLPPWDGAILPADLDMQFFQQAPPDQRVSRLRADEPIRLAGLSRDGATLVTKLPGIIPRATVERPSRLAETLPLTADTLWIDTDRALCALTWRGTVRLDRADDGGLVRVRLETVGQARSVTLVTEATPSPDLVLASSPSSPPAAPTFGPPPERPSSPPTFDGDMTVQPDGIRSDAPSLPFANAPPAAVALSLPEPGARPARRLRPTGTLTGLTSLPRPKQVLPFEERASSPVAIPPPGSTAELSPSPPDDIEPSTPRQAQHASPPHDVPLPPLVGPLATVEMWNRLARPPTAMEPVQAEQASPAPPEPPPPLPLRPYPLERCAAIAASIARRPDEEARILQDNDLEFGTFQSFKKHWDGEVGAAARRGKTDLLEAYDRSYVTQIEKERGPISVEEYARLAVAAERGLEGEVLRELGIPRGAALRIERLWSKKQSADASLAAQVREAIRRARER
ncbi:D-alanyl-D-alanine carboxypeptidase [Minicystis rosea]|nr:D-alanyl-D-alanine carboxypeptidase [Minicystis rosea]